MRVLIMDIDSKIPNLALKKIEKYHLDKGDNIVWNNELFQGAVDKTYVSIVFDWNKDKALQFPNAEIGGSGYDLKKVLPKEIDIVKPKINWGFTTRGCIRQCSFCIVPKKEGSIRVEGDVYDIWDGKSKEIVIMDNNIIALPEHFKKVCSQIKKENLRVDFNQGLDHRLLTNELAKILKDIKTRYYRFSFDNINQETTVAKALKILREEGIKRCVWFVLVGYNSTPQEDLYRANFLRDNNQDVYIQRYKYVQKEPFYIALARWGNQHHIFKGMTWEQFINRDENKKYKEFSPYEEV